MSINLDSLHSQKQRIRSALALNDLNKALALIHDCVERVITEPLCTAQVFGSRDLDDYCLEAGRKSFVGIDISRPSFHYDHTRMPLVVYIVSRLQRSGGHARLVQDFIRLQPEKYHLVLSTEVGGPSEKKFVMKYYNDDNMKLLLAPKGSFLARLEWLQILLLINQPDHIFLYNHHEDSVAAAAIIPEMGHKGSFIHHGDHHLCLGVFLNHLTHIDLHPMGYHYCRDVLSIKNHYLPLTFEDKGCILTQHSFLGKEGIITATAARSNKVEIPYFISYLDFIPRLLKATKGRHIHIGRLTPWGLRRICRKMSIEGVALDRFVYLEWTASVWKSLQDYRVDIYIASFPYGAGLTLIEAMGAGIPVIMHNHVYSSVLAGLELAYQEAFSWSDPEALIRHLKDIERSDLVRERELSRNQYELYHRPEILRSYVTKFEPPSIPVPLLSDKYCPQRDEWAVWVERQMTIWQIFRRFAYRSLRRLRNLAG